MNSLYKILVITTILILAIFSNPAMVKADSQIVEFSGVIKNEKNKKAIGNVSVTVPGTNIGTVTNSDGFFKLKIPASSVKNGIKIEQIGYQNLEMPLDHRNPPLQIFLQPSGKELKEVLVLGGNPRDIVEAAIKKIPQNYSDKDDLFSGFYRETVQKGNRFISISEAMVDILKRPYDLRTTRGEKVKINRGRKLVSPKPADTLGVKLMGGPYIPLALDAVKNGDHLFTIEEIDNFQFRMEGGETIDGRPHYSISFRPMVDLPYPLNQGTLYIDGENLSISRVEFELDMKDKAKVTRSILQKKPSGLKFKPLEVSGVVTYITVDGKSYINYISSKMRFKCDWKKRLFSSTYTSHAEMVMVDRNNYKDLNSNFNDSFGSRKIFSDLVENYWDENFWNDYNIIEPTESLEKAVDKLRKVY
ncbi:MAG: carboxypeptidase-like regulatory domain-containing protein [Muribaculaceae bacterium]|nr:carboxypeptidase-like regulatory domain-containing protein [Muribaculaceae bacterium]